MDKILYHLESEGLKIRLENSDENSNKILLICHDAAAQKFDSKRVEHAQPDI